MFAGAGVLFAPRGDSGSRVRTDGKSWVEPFCKRPLGGKETTKTLSEISGLKRIEFGRTTGHGLEWEGVVVTKVKDQALKLGVKPGCIFG